MLDAGFCYFAQTASFLLVESRLTEACRCFRKMNKNLCGGLECGISNVECGMLIAEPLAFFRAFALAFGCDSCAL